VKDALVTIACRFHENLCGEVLVAEQNTLATRSHATQRTTISLYFPASESHTIQSEIDCAPTVVEYLLATHGTHASAVDAPSDIEYVPTTHGTQSTSAWLPSEMAYLPVQVSHVQ